jgi:hypothetical protein
MKQDEALPKAANRRAFLKGAAMTGVGLAGAAVIGTKVAMQPHNVEAAIAVSDIDILNFALNLEYLEAEFCSVSTYGATLEKRGILTASEVSGPTHRGQKITNFGAWGTMATALREDEMHHVLFLRKALGSRAAKKPAIKLNALGYGFGSVGT